MKNYKLFYIVALSTTILLYVMLSILPKYAFELFSSKALGTKVTTGSFILNPLDGSLKAKKLVIHNPKNFKENHLFDANEVEFGVKVSSLATEIIEIKKLRVKSAVATYELDSDLSISENIEVLNKNIEKFKRQLELDKGKKEKKVIVYDLEIKDCRFHYNLEDKNKNTVSLANLQKKDIGVKEGGEYPRSVAIQILIEIILKTLL